MFVIMIFAYILIAYLDTYKTFRKKEYRKLAVYYLLMIISAAIGTLAGTGVKVPSPAEPIEQIVNAIGGIFY